MRIFLLATLLAATTHAGPLKVYILAGQSNMQGHASVTTFDYLAKDPKTAPLLAEMRDKDGNPRVCDRVWVSYLSQERDGNAMVKEGKLTAGFAARSDTIGPEFTFGITMLPIFQSFRDAMAAPASMPEFKGTVAAVLTEQFWDHKLAAARDKKERTPEEEEIAKGASNQGFHYLGRPNSSIRLERLLRRPCL